MTKLNRSAKALLTLATATAAVAGTTGVAQAQTTSQDSYYYYGSGTAGDCTLTAALDKATLFSWKVFGSGNVSCSLRHSSTQVTTTLKASNGTSSWNVATAATTFTNSFGTGSRWLQTSTTAFSCNPALYYQVVVSSTISGLGSYYVTTGSPKKVC